MLASQVRQRLLRQHRRLHSHIGRLDEQVLKVCRGATTGGSDLERLAKAFASALRHHMRDEERSLPEVLRYQIWGEQRLRLLRSEHLRQKRKLDAFEAALTRSFGLRQAADLVFALARAVEIDIGNEERELLNAAVLRDGVLHPDQETF